MSIHATWNSSHLLLWSDAHAQVDFAALREQVGSLCTDSLLVTVAAEAEFTLQVDSEAHQLRALSFQPAEAIDLLQAIPHPDSALLGDSVRFWMAVAKYVVERIRSQAFYPALFRATDGYRASWKPVVSSAEEIDRLEQLAGVLPPCATSNPADALKFIESFIAGTLDALIRRAASVDPFFTRVHRLAEEPEPGVDVRWMSALLGESNLMRGDPEDLQRHYEEVAAWTSPLNEPAISQQWKLGFELLEPPEESNDWIIAMRLDAVDSTTGSIRAEDVWVGGEIHGVLGRSLAERREFLRREISRAADVFPALNRLLESEAPARLIMSPEEAHLFLRRWSEQLLGTGFAVTLPAWADRRESRVGLKLSLHPSAADDWLDSEPDEKRGSAWSVAPGKMGLDALLDFDWRIAVGEQELTREEFEHLLEQQSPLVRLRGQWVEIDRAAAEAASKLLKENRQGKMTLGEAMRTAYGAGSQDGAVPVLGMTGTSWVQQLLEQLPAMKAESLEQPPEFVGTLRNYQLRGLHWLWFLDQLGIGACLADDMGLGKTIQLIALLLQERSERLAPGPTALFAPTSVVGNWIRELNRFAPKLTVMLHHGAQRLRGDGLREAAKNHDVLVTSYALAHRDLEDLSKINWHRIALDEAQKIKNPSAASTIAIKTLTASRRVALTGTPIENHLAELWSIMDALNPGLLGSAREFRERFAVPIEKLEDRDRAEHLKKMIRPFVLRRTKKDPEIAGDLPEKMEMNVYCSLTAEQAAMYERITAEMLARVDAADGIRRRGLILATLTRLKQVCDHPYLLTQAGEVDGRSGKCERLVDMLEEVLDEGEAALVFTQYREMGNILEKLIPKRLPTEVLFLHGGVNRLGREKLVERFQEPNSTARVFILSLRAGGLGLNLTAANHVFHYDRWWNPAVESQATDRAHRIGQTRTVQVHKFIAMGTLEERIDQMLSQKSQLADNIVGTGDEWLTSLSTKELKEYLQLSQAAVGEF